MVHDVSNGLLRLFSNFDGKLLFLEMRSYENLANTNAEHCLKKNVVHLIKLFTCQKS